MSEPAIESQLAQHALSVDLLGLLAVGILVLANGYFVATEFALVAVRRSQIRVWVSEGRRGAQAASDAIDRLDDAIAATQLGITIASIGLGWVGESVMSSLLSAPLEWLGIESRVALHTIATLIAFTLITFLHVVVGELAPKAIALQRPGEVALLFAQPLLVFGRVFRWVLVAMNARATRSCVSQASTRSRVSGSTPPRSSICSSPRHTPPARSAPSRARSSARSSGARRSAYAT